MITRTSRMIGCLIISLYFAICLSGCATAVVSGAAAGTVAYIKGDLNAVLEGSLDRSARAVDTAIERTKIVKISRSVDNLGATYVLRTALDEKVKIMLEPATSTTTDIVIRVGFFGDESISYRILNEIQKSM